MSRSGRKEAAQLLRELNLTLEYQRTTGGHLFTKLLTPKGNKLTATFPISPSDRRGLDNQRAVLRRAIRELDGHL